MTILREKKLVRPHETGIYRSACTNATCSLIWIFVLGNITHLLQFYQYRKTWKKVKDAPADHCLKCQHIFSTKHQAVAKLNVCYTDFLGFPQIDRQTKPEQLGVNQETLDAAANNLQLVYCLMFITAADVRWAMFVVWKNRLNLRHYWDERFGLGASSASSKKPQGQRESSKGEKFVSILSLEDPTFILSQPLTT